MKASNAAQHLRIWLAASGLNYGYAARERFVRAHPTLFGSAYEVPLRGYDRWRKRQGLFDRIEAFADYIAPRHQRWMPANPSSDLAPCLIGTPKSPPCWKTTPPAASLDALTDAGIAA